MPRQQISRIVQGKRPRSQACPLMLSLAVSLCCAEAWSQPADAETRRVKRGHVSENPQHFWPDNRVYYSLTNASASARRAFLLAARKIADNSYLSFVEHTDQPNYLYVTSSVHKLGCSSDLGMQGGPQALEISSFCQDPHTVLHEVMHVLGFHHEQQRPDRNQHISVIPALENEYNFRPLQGTRSLGAYDLESVMHYGPDYGGSTPAYRSHAAIPQRDDAARTELSSGDIASLRLLYPRPGTYASALPPADNELGATLSKRLLALAPHSSRQVAISIPAHIRVARFSAWSEHPAIANVSARAGEPHQYLLTVKASALGETRLFFRYTTAQGRVGTVILDSRVVSEQTLPQHQRQLVSPYNRQCLRARPNAARRASGPTPDNPHDRDLAWSPIEPEMLEIDLTPCDGDDPWQEWVLQEDGQLAIARINTKSCLLADAEGRLKMARCTCKPQTAPPQQQWRQEGGHLLHVGSHTVLTHASGNIPMAMPAGVSWQHWIWN